MKKVALSLAAVAAATVFAPEASAVPAFARQTGMACNACHQQHFPILNGFGRAFKADGFTMMGSQALIEEEHISLPSTLNAGILLKARYRMTNGNAKTVSTNDGAWAVPDEFGLFFGGRLTASDNLKVGTMIEHSMDNIVGFRIPMVTEIAGLKVSAVPFLTDALGPFYGYTESSTGLNRAVRWNEHHADISAHRFVGVATGAASGLTVFAKHEIGYVAETRWTPNFPMNDQKLSLNMIHAGFTPTIAGWDMVITGELISGTSQVATYSATDVFVNGADYSAMGATAQAQGEIAGMPTSLYATYASAGKSTSSAVNAYNSSTTDVKWAATVGGEVSVMPHLLHVGGAFRMGSAGGKSDNALSANATYDLAQNLGLQVTHSIYSGDKYKTTQAAGDSMTTLLLETAW
ncbi:MAG: hypothetical protein WC742_01705 [Gallionellaceae bacterium]|jgi:hypothetical protein